MDAIWTTLRPATERAEGVGASSLPPVSTAPFLSPSSQNIRSKTDGTFEELSKSH